MIRKIAVAILLLGQFGASAAAQTRPMLAPLPKRLTADRLELFASEAELRRYLRDVRREARKRNHWAGLNQPVLVAHNQDAPCTDPTLCPLEESDAANIVVTGAKASKPASITNVQ